MEENNGGISHMIRNGSSRKGSFRLGLGVNNNIIGAKDHHHTVVELGSIDTQKLLLASGEREIKQQPPPTNSLSQRQMKSLTALCDTILPSVVSDDFVGLSDESVATFYRVSASMAGTPQRVYMPLFHFSSV